MNNNISYDLRTFLSLTTEKKTIHTGLCAVTFFRSWFSGTIGKWCLTFSKLHTLKQSLRPPPLPPPPCIYYSRLSFKQAIWHAVLTSQGREQMLLSKELKKGIMSHKLKILPRPESKLKRKRLQLQWWNKNLHKPLVALEQAHGRYSPSWSAKVRDRVCVAQSVVRSSPQPV